MIELLTKPWPWYVAGPLLGLLVPLIYIFLNKGFGISSTMKDICAMCLPNTNISFFKYDWKSNAWNLLFALGVILGAFLVYAMIPNVGDVDISKGTAARLNTYGITDLKGLVPNEIFNWTSVTSPVTLILLCIGGFLVGFGTRYAGGCTSGHAVTGLSQLSKASFTVVIGFFTGGLISTWFLLPQILKLL